MFWAGLGILWVVRCPETPRLHKKTHILLVVIRSWKGYPGDRLMDIHNQRSRAKCFVDGPLFRARQSSLER